MDSPSLTFKGVTVSLVCDHARVSVLVDGKCVAKRDVVLDYTPAVGHVVRVRLYDDDENMTSGLGLVVKAMPGGASILWFYSRSEMAAAGNTLTLPCEYTLTDDVADVDQTECERYLGFIDKNRFLYHMGSAKSTSLTVGTVYHIANTHGQHGVQSAPQCFGAGHGATYKRTYEVAVASVPQYVTSMDAAGAKVYGNVLWFKDMLEVEQAILWLNDIHTGVNTQ